MTQKKHSENTETQSCKTGVKRCTGYKGYKIDIDNTGYAPKNMQFHFWIEDGETVLGYGESIADCKKQIDEL
jgi:hypothetical protein